jgi:hypothetical protein
MLSNAIVEQARALLIGNKYQYPVEVDGIRISEPPRWVWHLRTHNISVQEGAWGYEVFK